MSLQTSCCLAGYAEHLLYHLVDNETISVTVPFNLDIPPAIGCDDCRFESKLFLLYLERSKNSRHEPQAIFVNIELRCLDKTRASQSNSQILIRDP
jgi:hypothetical protein